MDHERPWKNSSGHAAAATALQPEGDGDPGAPRHISRSWGKMGKGAPILCCFPIGKAGLGHAASNSAMPRDKMHQRNPTRAGAGGAVGPHGE